MATLSLDVLSATAEDLQHRLQLKGAERVSSEQLVNVYLEQIKKHEDYLHALISIAPQDSLIRRAKALDEEREAGKIRSSLHGIPVLVKDNIATHPDLGMDTTAGSLALIGSKPLRSAAVVERLLRAGAIILGKANLSEFAFYKGSRLMCGWSAAGGQSQSAYVKGGLLDGDSYAGHTNPGGSSSGSAVGVSAGYAPIALGTETEGSLVMPAGRAALYTIKPTISIVPTDGVIPATPFCDAVGPMTKSVKDLANLLDILVNPEKAPEGGYISAATGSWEGLKVGTLDTEKWDFSRRARKVLDPSIEKEMKDQAEDAYLKVEKLASKFHNHVPLIDSKDIDLDGVGVLGEIVARDLKIGLEHYLSTELEPGSAKVHSLKDIITFNEEHADKELPPENPNQTMLEKSEAANISAKSYENYTTHARRVAREDGVDKIFKEYDLNVIIGPIESDMDTIASAAGYPLATLPLGCVTYNGRPHGLAAIAGANQEAILIQLQSAWEASFPKRLTPPLLSRHSLTSL